MKLIKYISLINLVIWFNIQQVKCKQLAKPLIMLDDCSNDEFFDTVELNCKKCDSEVADKLPGLGTTTASSSRVNQNVNNSIGITKSIDGFGCSCSQSGWYRVYHDKGFSCLPCPTGTVSSFSGRHCSICSPTNSYQSDSRTCSPCPVNYINDERPIVGSKISEEPLLERYCKPCPHDSVSNSYSNQCVTCHPSTVNCSCPKDHYSLYGGICLPNSNLITEKVDLYQVTYENEYEVNSAFFMENLQSSVYQCQFKSNRSACQLLANLCTLLDYNLFESGVAFASSSSSSPTNTFLSGKSIVTNACTEYLRLSKLPTVPFLIYGDNGVNELRKANVISKMYKIDSKLEIVAARYDGHGKLVDLSHLKPGELQLCKTEPDSLESGFYFGTNYYQKCFLEVRDLWDASATSPESLLFYDLYLLDDDQEPDAIYPIPILITNLKENGELVNRDGEDEQRRRLVRRFYLTESLVGIELKKDVNSEGGSDAINDAKLREDRSNGSPESGSNYLRYASSITINVKLSKTDGSGSIYPPWIKVSYSLVTREDYLNQARVPVEFRIIYSMDGAKSSRDLSISLGVFCGLAVLISLFRAWAWSKRQGKQPVDPVTISEFLLITAGFLANAFFLVSIGFSVHWFIIYKQQSVIHGLLPSPGQESTIHIYLYIAFALKSIKIIHDLIILSHTNIFFIDWERPRVITITKRPRNDELGEKKVTTGMAIGSGVSAASGTDEPSSVSLINPESGNRRSSLAGSGGGGTNLGITGKIGQDKLQLSHCPAVSIWRTYFVANEWIKLATHRRIKTSLHLFFVILLLHCIGLENLASADTSNNLSPSSNQRYVPESSTCRLAIGSLVFFLAGMAQLIWFRVFYERMYKNRLDEFVDLCSVSNVSLFCLLYQRFGYYIHGRSPNGRADVNMKEMHELLKREEDDLCSKRGLLPNTDQQTFEMLLPSSINDQCSRIRSLLTTYSQGAERMQGVGGHLFKVDLEKVVPTYVMLTKFLSGFIEHAFKDADYTVKDKSNVELILDFELAEPRERGFLYNDNGHSFDALLFSGNEFNLFTFELMLFIFVDLLSHNAVVSAIITFLVIEMIKNFYIIAYKRNIVVKALIDERFLI